MLLKSESYYHLIKEQPKILDIKKGYKILNYTKYSIAFIAMHCELNVNFQ